MNIDNFMTPFLRMIYDGISNTYHTMELLQFGNTNLLQVMIIIMILGVALPILLSLSQNVVKVESGGKNKKNKGGRSK